MFQDIGICSIRSAFDQQEQSLIRLGKVLFNRPRKTYILVYKLALNGIN